MYVVLLGRDDVGAEICQSVDGVNSPCLCRVEHGPADSSTQLDKSVDGVDMAGACCQMQHDARPWIHPL